MSDFFNGFSMARATGSRTIRILLILFLAGALVAGIIYVGVVFKAVSERSNTPHVHAHSSH
jgi:hypothetical protein